jgi:hypothetical protein
MRPIGAFPDILPALLAHAYIVPWSETLRPLPMFVAVVYVSIFVHELGHAVCGRAAGFWVSSFGLGTARPWCVFPAGRMRIYFALVRPFQGITFATMPHRDSSRSRQLLFGAGGIIANGLLALVALGIELVSGSEFWLIVAFVNGYLSGINLVPLRVRIGKATVRSDGMLLLRIWWSGSIPTPAPMIIQTLSTFRRLWTAIGDTVTLRVYLLVAAESWAYLNEPDRASELFAEAESLPRPDVPGMAALEMLTRAEVDIQAGHLSEAEAALAMADVEYRAIGHEGGQLVTTMLRARIRRLRGDAGGAFDDLQTLAARPIAAQRPELGALVFAEWLLAAIERDDSEAVATLVEGYERSRVIHPSATRDLAIYTALARSRVPSEDWAGAGSSYRRVVEAVASLAAAWNDATERTRFLESRSALLHEAREAILRSGEDPATVDRLIRKATPPNPADLEARDRRLRRIGYRLLLANLAFVAGAIWLATSVGFETLGPLIVVPLAVALFTAVGIVYLAFDQTVGRLVPTLRRSGGAVLLLVGCLPWLSGIVGLLLALIDPLRRR